MTDRHERDNIVTRACDACKASKLKCDAGDNNESQCSRCKRKDISCTFVSPVKKRGPRARPTTSPRPSDVRRRSAATVNPRSPPLILAPTIDPGHAAPACLAAPRIERRMAQFVGSPGSPSLGSTDVWSRLLQDLHRDSGPPVESRINECIDLYLQHLFPTTPLLHEESVRDIVARAFDAEESLVSDDFSVGSSGFHASPSSLGIASPAQFGVSDYASPLSRPERRHRDWKYARSLSLVCAFCAFVCSVVPAHLFSLKRPEANIFLQASKELLLSCHDRDMDRPEASSIVIRYLHSLCSHAAGSARGTWFILGEAIRLAQEMRIYDEASLSTLDLVEAQLRRTVYWQLYTGDRSAAILNSRPFTLHHLLLDTPMTLRPLTDDDIHLLDNSRRHNTVGFQQRLNKGFNLSSHLFGTASTVVLDLRLLQDFSRRTSSGSVDLIRGQTASVVDSLIAFRCSLDDLPPWLQEPWNLELEQEADVTEYQRGCFWIQHVNLKVTFHCLRMIILQTAVDLGLTSLLGLSDNPRLVAMEQAEIARDLLQCVRGAPFEALQLNGESCVEKIRQVGVVLLRISQDMANQPLAIRANADFQILLNVLARLDSKASDSLSQEINVEWP